MDGRLSLNPMAHFDEVGTGLIPVIAIALGMMTHGSASNLLYPPMLGWGRSIDLALNDPKQRARHEVIVACGGLAMNLLLALIFALVGGLLGGSLPAVERLCEIGIIANAGLFMFHLLPIPPLDGWVFLCNLTRLSANTLEAWARWGFIVFLLVINFTPLGFIFFGLIRFVAFPFFSLMSAL